VFYCVLKLSVALGVALSFTGIDPVKTFTGIVAVVVVAIRCFWYVVGL
jgi:hypothetical protein